MSDPEFKEDAPSPQNMTDLEMMQSVARWPQVNVLALKKRDGTFGTLRWFADDTFGLYEGIPVHDALAILNEENPRILQPTELHQLTDEGWLVD